LATSAVQKIGATPPRQKSGTHARAAGKNKKDGSGGFDDQAMEFRRPSLSDASTLAHYNLGLAFRQKGGPESLTVFAHNAALRNTLQGFIWLRLPDYLPLRIRLLSSRKEGLFVVNTEGTVDYAMSSHGGILPAAVVHRDTVGDKLMTENIFGYTAFRKFGAESELKFDTP
jgi:hypothetical protein